MLRRVLDQGVCSREQNRLSNLKRGDESPDVPILAHRGSIETKAKDTVRSIYTEAGQEKTAEPERKALAAWAIKSEDARRLAAMISLARSEPGMPIAPEQLDADPWLLTCTNGTIDLRTGALLPHCRDDLITKCIPVE
jgi:putative DNA primase/helicase